MNSLMVSGTMEIYLQYLRNTSSRGCFLVLSQDQYTGYFAIKKPIGRDEQTVVLDGLPQGVYTVNGYDIDNGTLSSNPVPAVGVHNVILNQGAAFWNKGKNCGKL